MKIFAFLCAALLCANAQAITIQSVSGASNDVKLNGNYSPVFMAGVSGASRCTGEKTTVNTCANSQGRAACNFKTVCPSTRLEITFTAKTSGKVALFDISEYPVHQIGQYEAGKTYTASIPWEVICYNLSSDRECSVPTRGVLRLGIDAGGDYHPEESASYIFQVSMIQNNRLESDIQTPASISDTQGIDTYTILPGDKKAYLQEFKVLNTLYIGEAARIIGLRAFFAPTTCAKIQDKPYSVNTSHDSSFLPLSANQSEITDNVIEGVQNNVKYAFMLGLQDEAGNIGMYKDLQVECVEGQHTATPKAL